MSRVESCKGKPKRCTYRRNIYGLYFILNVRVPYHTICSPALSAGSRTPTMKSPGLCGFLSGEYLQKNLDWAKHNAVSLVCTDGHWTLRLLRLHSGSHIRTGTITPPVRGLAPLDFHRRTSMDRPSKPVLIAVFSVVALYVGAGAYLVFTGQMDSRLFLTIGVAIGGFGALVRLARR